MEGRYPFNVRVYGLLFDASGEHILISDERIQGQVLSKFPGGGLHFGEGPEECVVREFQEEVGIEVGLLAHFYTTGFFQRSAFQKDEQVISIYYRVESEESIPSELLQDAKGSTPTKEGVERFRWVRLDELNEELLDLPIDRKVLGMLRKT